MGEALRQLGETRQRLLRQLLPAADGCTVETLCERLRISHNAVRQHLTALIGRGWVRRVEPLPSGGRPQMRYGLTASGRDLFPRNYGLLSTALLAQLHERLGDAGLEALLEQLGRNMAAAQPLPVENVDHEALVRALAQRLDELGYEAVPARHHGEWQVEAFNCVFHALARQHPQVCRFDLAYMKAATGQRIHHMECIVRGGHVCRFRVGPEPASSDPG
ncbi:helix-turn-helix domain-containing protein [Pseudoxanthomonas helianthi]|uniref:Helix-turn-helix domain-containing protein n=1 Tax=Pseudoxanthomonas helianthi TaxID=1453541 RepID=A0A941AXC2_9GAMM|nr:helix-turn-helix domain-containing protein [Pseudoxanthomonas helianthi]MBP3985952.1 helix-turn-helix domain-containing protein [Pseudoxanthomonas helianthi]